VKRVGGKVVTETERVGDERQRISVIAGTSSKKIPSMSMARIDSTLNNPASALASINRSYSHKDPDQ